MMMWQEIITYGIGILVITYLGIRIYRFFSNKKRNVSRCGGCSGCCLQSQNHRHPSTPGNAP